MNIFGKTPLCLAVEWGHLSVCQWIFNNVQDKNLKNDIGQAALHIAATTGQFEIFKMIFENVEDKNCLDVSKMTPLHSARRGHLEIYRYILNQHQKVLDDLKSQIEKF